MINPTKNDSKNDIQSQKIMPKLCHFCKCTLPLQQKDKLECSQCPNIFDVYCVETLERNKKDVIKNIRNSQEKNKWICLACSSRCPCKSCRKCCQCSNKTQLEEFNDIITQYKISDQLKKDIINQKNEYSSSFLSLDDPISNLKLFYCQNCKQEFIKYIMSVMNEPFDIQRINQSNDKRKSIAKQTKNEVEMKPNSLTKTINMPKTITHPITKPSIKGNEMYPSLLFMYYDLLLPMQQAKLNKSGNDNINYPYSLLQDQNNETEQIFQQASQIIEVLYHNYTNSNEISERTENLKHLQHLNISYFLMLNDSYNNTLKLINQLLNFNHIAYYNKELPLQDAIKIEEELMVYYYKILHENEEIRVLHKRMCNLLSIAMSHSINNLNEMISSLNTNYSGGNDRRNHMMSQALGLQIPFDIRMQGNIINSKQSMMMNTGNEYNILQNNYSHNEMNSDKRQNYE